jgi:hypothetical protein
MLPRPPLEELLVPGDPPDPADIPDEVVTQRRLAAQRAEQAKIKP